MSGSVVNVVTLENKSAEKVGTEKDLINGTNNITKIKFQSICFSDRFT